MRETILVQNLIWKVIMRQFRKCDSELVASHLDKLICVSSSHPSNVQHKSVLIANRVNHLFQMLPCLK